MSNINHEKVNERYMAIEKLIVGELFDKGLNALEIGMVIAKLINFLSCMSSGSIQAVEVEYELHERSNEEKGSYAERLIIERLKTIIDAIASNGDSDE